MSRSPREFAGAIRAGIVLIAIVLTLILVWQVGKVVLMAFGGVLFGIFLRTLADWVADKTPLSGGWSLAIVVLLLVSLLGLGAWFKYPRLAAQATELAESLPDALDKVRAVVERSPVSNALPSGNTQRIRDSLFSGATTLAEGAFNMAVAVVVIAFVGLYLAASPWLYREGLIRLFPRGKRDRVREVLGQMGSVLRRWIMARLVLMVINGGLTTIGLWILGIPLGLILGVIAGTLNFVPNIGPFVAAVPALLIAFAKGPQEALYVALLYLALQMIDGYVFTPIAQKRAVSLAPALIITAQVLMGILGGSLGLLFATPIAAAILVMVRMLYLEDVLHERPAQ